MSVAEYDDDRAPLLDSSVLLRLREELDGDEGVWKVFIQNFVNHLPARTEKLRLALTTGDSAGAMVAVLSLKTSSQMVGAERLAGLVLELEHLLRVECSDLAHGAPDGEDGCFSAAPPLADQRSVTTL